VRAAVSCSVREEEANKKEKERRKKKEEKEKKGREEKNVEIFLNLKIFGETNNRQFMGLV
jgi:ribosomal protein L12E/L44/L45/RPP1/RPP2